jgi:hypothetical protein
MVELLVMLIDVFVVGGLTVIFATVLLLVILVVGLIVFVLLNVLSIVLVLLLESHIRCLCCYLCSFCV